MRINRVVVEGYKSLKQRTEVELRRLTILSGANSSGKTSVMQPLLLLKQTFSAGYDPGPLLISGPNVVFSETDQMLWSAVGQSRSNSFRLGLSVVTEREEAGMEVLLRREERGPTPLEIKECIWNINKRKVSLRENMRNGEIQSAIEFSEERRERLLGRFIGELQQQFKLDDTNQPQLGFAVERRRAFLIVNVEFVEPPILGFSFPYLPDPFTLSLLEQAVRQIIHVPGLRGNPRRTYPVTAVEVEFPGLFQDYVASVIAQWQRKDRAKVNQLGRDLKQLGLTWKVRAERKSDTEVEIRVGRLPTSRRGGSRDLVSIADVGFGFSQSLPVAVALLTASPDHMVYLEQPEIHLHPRAQVDLIELIHRAVQRGVQVIVETHSELLLLGVQKLIATGALPTDKVLLHWFSRDDGGMTNITTAEFDEKGTLGDVPVDFTEVSMSAMHDYLEAVTQTR